MSVCACILPKSPSLPACGHGLVLSVSLSTASADLSSSSPCRHVPLLEHRPACLGFLPTGGRSERSSARGEGPCAPPQCVLFQGRRSSCCCRDGLPVSLCLASASCTAPPLHAADLASLSALTACRRKLPTPSPNPFSRSASARKSGRPSTRPPLRMLRRRPRPRPRPPSSARRSTRRSTASRRSPS